jgi:magnesium chelatase family protein
LSSGAEAIIRKAFEVLHLSVRGYHKVLKVARTIADIEQSALIEEMHIREALLYRLLDKKLEL